MSDEHPEAFDLPKWSGDCSREAVLVAGAIMRLAEETHRLRAELDWRLARIETSLDSLVSVQEG